MPDNEFYIGWMAKAPGGIAKHVRRVIFILIFLIIAAATLLSLQQRQFSTAVFEFGQLTEVKGIYHRFPVPSIQVTTSRDAFGRSAGITIPLVGYGKSGAAGVISELEKARGINLDKRSVTLKGSLLYSDGKTILQIDKNDQPLIAVANETNAAVETKELGFFQLTGEVLDPKCYFGVMKPGHGKPHKDCAIRCIAGGISPVFWTVDEKGETQYFLILDENGTKMNNELKDHVGEPISLRARAVQYNDWTILYADRSGIKRTGGLSWFKKNDQSISCAPGK